jgi:NRPS condensation-like uncharacterized protein
MPKELAELVRSLRKRGVALWVEGEEVRHQAAPCVLSAEECEMLHRRNAEVATLLRSAKPVSAIDPAGLERASDGTFPLSFQQQWLWNVVQPLAKRQIVIGCALRIGGPLNLEALRRSLEALVGRHDALRMTMCSTHDSVAQHLNHPTRYELVAVPVRGESADGREGQVRERVAALFQEAASPRAGAQFVAKLFVLDARDHVLALAMDHMISDGASVGLLLRDLWMFYAQAICGEPIWLPRIEVQYPDYALWQRQTAGPWSQIHGVYWQRRLERATPIQLPMPGPVLGVKPFTSAMLPTRFGKKLSAALGEMTQREQATLPMLVLTAYVAVLARWCDSTDLVVPFNTVGRHLSELANTVGFFAHNVYLRIVFDRSATLREVLHQVVKEHRASCAHPDFGRTVAQRPEFIDGSWFQWDATSFVGSETPSETIPESAKYGNDGLTVEPFPFETRFPEMDMKNQMVLRVVGTAADLVADCYYRADHFPRAGIEAFSARLVAICQRFVDDPISPALL